MPRTPGRSAGACTTPSPASSGSASAGGRTSTRWEGPGLHIERADHPLHIIHDYAPPAAEIAKFAASISRLRPSALGSIRGFSRRRARHLPYAAMLLAELVEATGPRTVRFCSTGIREGVVHSRLPDDVQARDVLLSAA